MYIAKEFFRLRLTALTDTCYCMSFLMLYTCILFVKINYISERTLRFVVSMYKHFKTKWRRNTFTSTCIHGPDPLHRRLPTGDRVFCLKDAITHESPLDSRMNTNITYLKFSPMQRTLQVLYIHGGKRKEQFITLFKSY